MHILNERRTTSDIQTARRIIRRHHAGEMFSRPQVKGESHNLRNENNDAVLIRLATTSSGFSDNCERREYCASSSLLIAASPVFERILNTGPNRKGTLSLRTTGRPTWALWVVLEAIHLEEDRIPTEVDTEEFYSLVETCGKYDCMHVLAPWVKLWTKQLWRTNNQGGYQGHQPRSEPSWQQGTQSTSGANMNENILTLELLEEIMEMRLAKIRKIQSIIRELYKHMENHAPSLFAFQQQDSSSKQYPCYENNMTSEKCVGTSYYYFINEAQKLNIWRYIDISTNNLRLDTAPYSLWVFHTNILCLLDGMRKVRHGTRDQNIARPNNSPCALESLMNSLQVRIESEIQDASIWETTDYSINDTSQLIKPLIDLR